MQICKLDGRVNKQRPLRTLETLWLSSQVSGQNSAKYRYSDKLCIKFYQKYWQNYIFMTIVCQFLSFMLSIYLQKQFNTEETKASIS